MRRTCRSVGILLLALAAGSAAGCTDPAHTEAGTTRIRLTDAPFPYEAVGSVQVFIVSVAVSRTADTGTSAGSQEWITVAEPDRAFDLLTLDGGQTALLGESPLPAAEYLAVRVVVDVDRSRVTWKDGSAAPVSWGGSGQMTLHVLVEHPITVPDAGGDIIIDFDVGRCFPSTGPAGPFIFIPWVRAVDRAATGDILGRVLGVNVAGEAPAPQPNVAVSLLRVPPPQEIAYLIATARSDAGGRFALRFVTEGSYLLNLAVPGFEPVTSEVEVKAGQIIEPDIVLQPGGNSAIALLRIWGRTEMAVGEVATFAAVGFDQQGDSVVVDDVAWFSSDPSVAAVTLPVSHGGSRTALVQAQAVGSAVISAVSAGVWDTLRVRVKEGSGGAAVAVIELQPSSQAIAAGDTAAIAATLRDASGQVLTGREIGWASSDTAIVRIEGSANGSVALRGVAPGTATVTATSEGKSANAAVTVKQP